MKPYTALLMVTGITMLLACARAEPAGTGTIGDAVLITPRQLGDIAGIEWHLKKMKMDNNLIPLIEDTTNTFSCDDRGKVAGVASINRYFGNFILKQDGEIIWSKAFGMTRMAGPPDLMEQEAAFMKALAETSRMYTKGSLLIMTSGNRSTLLQFQKADN